MSLAKWWISGLLAVSLLFLPAEADLAVAGTTTTTLSSTSVKLSQAVVSGARCHTDRLRKAGCPHCNIGRLRGSSNGSRADVR